MAADNKRREARAWARMSVLPVMMAGNMTSARGGRIARVADIDEANFSNQDDRTALVADPPSRRPSRVSGR
ncbi:hypothetical protein ACIG87_10610 [Micromonospora sp. NPDC051925]|uniref:hypothetical protein n=1 Tax=Micromonospora sp. NPDC051925 TaxID=3364288 RepID=UPI0037C88FB9